MHVIRFRTRPGVVGACGVKIVTSIPHLNKSAPAM
jgi:hypothetical protein